MQQVRDLDTKPLDASAGTMIDAQAVLADLVKLRNLESNPENAPRSAGLLLLQEQMEQLSVRSHRDDAGNEWLTLPGKSERAVVLGSCLKTSPARSWLDSCLGVVAGLETIKALAHRYDAHPPCTLQLVVWAEPGEARSDRTLPATSVFALQNVAAYLELHIEPGTELQHAGTPLAVGTASSSVEPVAFNPRLMALCDEAIRELTGQSASLPSGPAFHAEEAARQGIPAAIMSVQALAGFADEEMSQATRLHLLEAAEAFGRWAEATVHLVGGEAVDLWALEHRVPHS